MRKQTAKLLQQVAQKAAEQERKARPDSANSAHWEEVYRQMKHSYNELGPPQRKKLLAEMRAYLNK